MPKNRKGSGKRKRKKKLKSTERGGYTQKKKEKKRAEKRNAEERTKELNKKSLKCEIRKKKKETALNPPLRD